MEERGGGQAEALSGKLVRGKEDAFEDRVKRGEGQRAGGDQDGQCYIENERNFCDEKMLHKKAGRDGGFSLLTVCL